MFEKLIRNHAKKISNRNKRLARKALERRLLESSNSFGTTCMLSENGKKLNRIWR